MCIQLRDEGEIYAIIFRDIEFVSRYHSDPWWGRGEAISFTAIPRTAATKLGKLHDVLVENVSGRAENSIRINGCAESRIESVHLKNVSVKFARWTKYVGDVYDNRPTKVYTPIELHAADGINLRHADDVTVKNCSLKWGADPMSLFGAALATDDVHFLNLYGFKGDSAEHSIYIR